MYMKQFSIHFLLSYHILIFVLWCWQVTNYRSKINAWKCDNMQVFINSSKVTCFDNVQQSCFVIYNDKIYLAVKILETEFMYCDEIILL